jgi:hypothetical protein
MTTKGVMELRMETGLVALNLYDVGDLKTIYLQIF